MNADRIQARIDRLTQIINGLSVEADGMRRGSCQSGMGFLDYVRQLEDAIERLNFARGQKPKVGPTKMRAGRMGWAWGSLLIGGQSIVFGLVPGILMLLGVALPRPLMAVLGHFSCCIAQPFLPIAGIVAGLVALQDPHPARPLAVWGIALCVLTEIVFLIDLVYFWIHFPRHIVA